MAPKNPTPEAETAAPTAKTITIQGVEVSVSSPYAAGHVVTDAEARALNQVRAENIGNNLRKQVKDMLAEEGADPATVKDLFQPIVTEYDASYEFTLASVGGGSTAKLSPVEKEARRIARELIGDKLKEMGVTQKAYAEENGEDALKIKIAEVAEMEAVLAKAAENLERRAKIDDLTL